MKNEKGLFHKNDIHKLHVWKVKNISTNIRGTFSTTTIECHWFWFDSMTQLLKCNQNVLPFLSKKVVQLQAKMVNPYHTLSINTNFSDEFCMFFQKSSYQKISSIVLLWRWRNNFLYYFIFFKSCLAELSWSTDLKSCEIMQSLHEQGP